MVFRGEKVGEHDDALKTGADHRGDGSTLHPHLHREDQKPVQKHVQAPARYDGGKCPVGIPVHPEEGRQKVRGDDHREEADDPDPVFRGDGENLLICAEEDKDLPVP